MVCGLIVTWLVPWTSTICRNLSRALASSSFQNFPFILFLLNARNTSHVRRQGNWMANELGGIKTALSWNELPPIWLRSFSWSKNHVSAKISIFGGHLFSRPYGNRFLLEFILCLINLSCWRWRCLPPNGNIAFVTNTQGHPPTHTSNAKYRWNSLKSSGLQNEWMERAQPFHAQCHLWRIQKMKLPCKW